MIEVTLQPTARWRDVVREQVRIVGLGLRLEALIFAAVLGVATFLIVTEIVAGGPGFDSREILPTAAVAFLLPFAVWRRDQRFGPAFLWTLPVGRRTLALAKVFAGGVWLMAALAVLGSWLVTLALLAHSAPVEQLKRIPLTITITAYLFGSALVLGLRHPLRWLFGAAGVILLTGSLNDALGSGPTKVDGLLTALGLLAATSETAPPGPITSFLWLGVAFVALWAAASRHRERRRH